MKTKCRLYKGKNGWRWTVRADNGKIVGASTEAYVKRVHAVENMQLVSLAANPFQIPAPKRGAQFYEWVVEV